MYIRTIKMSSPLPRRSAFTPVPSQGHQVNSKPFTPEDTPPIFALARLRFAEYPPEAGYIEHAYEQLLPGYGIDLTGIVKELQNSRPAEYAAVMTQPPVIMPKEVEDVAAATCEEVQPAAAAATPKRKDRRPPPIRTKPDTTSIHPEINIFTIPFNDEITERSDDMQEWSDTLLSSLRSEPRYRFQEPFSVSFFRNKGEVIAALMYPRTKYHLKDALTSEDKKNCFMMNPRNPLREKLIPTSIVIEDIPEYVTTASLATLYNDHKEEISYFSKHNITILAMPGKIGRRAIIDMTTYEKADKFFTYFTGDASHILPWLSDTSTIRYFQNEDTTSDLLRIKPSSAPAVRKKTTPKKHTLKTPPAYWHKGKKR
jgi:hypothetical protein